jgi:hypothetical protein
VLLDNNQCDDARLLWLKEFFGHNDIPSTIAGTMLGRTKRKLLNVFCTCSKFFDCEELAIDGRKITNPVRNTVQLELKQQSTCLRAGGGCEVPGKSVTGKVRHKKFGYLRAMSTSDDPLDLIKSSMEEHTTTRSCAIAWEQNLEGLPDVDPCTSFDPAELAGTRYCPGSHKDWPFIVERTVRPTCYGILEHPVGVLCCNTRTLRTVHSRYAEHVPHSRTRAPYRKLPKYCFSCISSWCFYIP